MKLRVGAKISGGFTIVLCILFLMGGYTYYRLGEADDTADAVLRANLRSGALNKTQESYWGAVAAIRGYLASGNEDFVKQAEEKFAATLKYADEALKLSTRPAIRAGVELFMENIRKYREGVQTKLFPAAKAYHAEKKSPTTSLAAIRELEAKYLSSTSELISLTETVDKEINDMTAEVAKTTTERLDHLDGLIMVTQRMILILTTVSLIIGILLSVTLTRGITRPLIAATKRLEIMAGGDYSKEIEKSFLARGDEFGTMAQAFDKLNRGMRAIIRQVAQSSEQVAASSEELTAGAQQSADASGNIAASIQQVARGSEKQVNAVNETSAIVQEISATMEEVSATAGEMATMSEKAAKAAIEGKISVDRAVTQMGAVSAGAKQAQTAAEELKTSSAQIGEIVELISTIAGQTNLLALNAAIEAARAGDAGRGFAVVAEEVRKLAEQSDNAAHQITKLVGSNHSSIGNVVGAIDIAIRDITQGVELVNVAGTNFAAINAQVRQETDQVGIIAKAINEAAAGSRRIVGSIKDVESLSRDAAAESQNVSAATEEQSASMEEIAASSQALAKLAEELQKAVSKFRI